MTSAAVLPLSLSLLFFALFTNNYYNLKVHYKEKNISSEILATIRLFYNPRVNIVFSIQQNKLHK